MARIVMIRFGMPQPVARWRGRLVVGIHETSARRGLEAVPADRPFQNSAGDRRPRLGAWRELERKVE
jgi:hypothetical protein